jgi:thiamine-monophosphate kinase
MTTGESFTPVADIGEFGLIERVQQRLTAGTSTDLLTGIGDDAAVYRVADGKVHIVTTDALIEGVHFDRTFVPMRHLGFKALAVNVSDIVAMNGTPRFATIALGLPHNISVEMAEAFYDGLDEAATLYGVTIIGGDMTASQRLVISVTVIGEAPEERVVRRSGARPGDLICVSGDLGSSFAGLKVLLDQKKRMEREGDAFKPALDDFPYVIRRHLRPAARLDLVRGWEQAGVRPNALIDISDGLASELHHLCKQSGTGALVHAATIPIDLETRHVADQVGEDVDTFALFGGEDYELLFALSEDDLERLPSDSFTVIGHFTPPDEGIQLKTPEGGTIPLDAQGYAHFGG